MSNFKDAVRFAADYPNIIAHQITATVNFVKGLPEYVGPLRDGYVDAETHTSVTSEMMMPDRMYFHPLSPNSIMTGKGYEAMLERQPRGCPLRIRRKHAYLGTMTPTIINLTDIKVSVNDKRTYRTST